MSGRPKGAHYSPEQRRRILQGVALLHQEGLTIRETLRSLGVCRSSYYAWLRADRSERPPSILRLTDSERQAVLEKKQTEPQLSPRKISGHLRHQGLWISPSSCYRILKGKGWMISPDLREAPWKVPHYEPYQSNQIWGEDWTLLNIAGRRHYLLTIIDYFSRYVLAWGIVPSVTHREVQALLALAYLSQGLEGQEAKPLLRTDRGSPNLERGTKRLIRDLELILSPSRADRPTDNARQERWYRTVKQEEIYLYPTYPSLEIARSSLAGYIESYNERRPHQALWNYTPGQVHRLGNKSRLIEHYRLMVKHVKEQRLKANRVGPLEIYSGGPKLTPFWA